MAIVLFTDFGSADPYAGQVDLVLASLAPDARVVHLLHDAPAYAVRASAHLLASMVERIPRGAVVLAVVDPGVGTARRGVVLEADGRWYVGPDNGLLSVVAARYGHARVWHLPDPEPDASPSFHGRDVFAPVAAALALGTWERLHVDPDAGLEVRFAAGDLAEIIYCDHYGNAFTGIRGAAMGITDVVVVNGHRIGHARVFGEAPPDGAFWYVNSQDLVEIAVNQASARVVLALTVGMAVSIVRDAKPSPPRASAQ